MEPPLLKNLFTIHEHYILDCESILFASQKITKDKGGEGLIKELQDHVKRTTAPYKYPRKARFMIPLICVLKISLDCHY